MLLCVSNVSCLVHGSVRGIVSIYECLNSYTSSTCLARFTLKDARVVRQPGDGSCLFHSLAHGIGDGDAGAYDSRSEKGWERHLDRFIAFFRFATVFNVHSCDGPWRPGL